MQDLEPADLEVLSVAYGVSGSGQVVGTIDWRFAYAEYAFLMSNGGSLQNLGTLGGSYSRAYGVNYAGQAVGWASTSGNHSHAFLYSASGTMQDLGTLPGAISSVAFGINDKSQVVGYSLISGPNTGDAFLSNGSGPMQDLGKLPGAASSVAYAINNSGQIVGGSGTIVGAPLPGGFVLGHAFLYEGNGPMQDLGTLPGQSHSTAFGINNSGVIVGTSGNDAFVRSGNVPMQDLNALVSPSSGWTLTQANAINDRGQIVGYGTNSAGQTHAFLLTPAPVNYRQSDPMWSGESLLGSQYRVGTSGCFLTAATIVLDTWGHNVTPSTLNAFLSTGSDGSGNLFFSKLNDRPSYGQADDRGGARIRFCESTFAANATRDQITDTLANSISENGPVVLRVPAWGHGMQGYPSDWQHAIVAWQVANGEVYIRNPGSQYTGLQPGDDINGLTLDDYMAYVNASPSLPSQYTVDTDLSWLDGRRYTWAEPIEPGSPTKCYAVVKCPVEVLITDPQGRKLGRRFDAVSGLWTDYNDIPGSVYDRLSLVLDAEEDSDPSVIPPLELQLGEVIAGTYSLQVFGIGAGAFSIDLGQSDFAGFDPNQYAFSGIASDGSCDTFTFELTPEPATLTLLALGGAAAILRRRVKK